MIEKYFEDVENTINYFKNVQFYTSSKKIYSDGRGYIEGIIVFKDERRLDFAEYTDIDDKSKLKYRYHYMDKNNNLIFRYDNAPHHKKIQTFPHHKHLKDKVVESSEVSLFDVLIEIARSKKKSGS